LAHPQVLARGMVLEVEHPVDGRYKSLGCPIHMSATPPEIKRAAPLLGEHTRLILGEAGYSAGEIDAMVQAGTVAEPREVAHA
ncbi:MAG: CoA transferase, partial [Bradyrhizobium sp.]|nr:CoA transferase [Bradyrhizobium sp.]